MIPKYPVCCIWTIVVLMIRAVIIARDRSWMPKLARALSFSFGLRPPSVSPPDVQRMEFWWWQLVGILIWALEARVDK